MSEDLNVSAFRVVRNQCKTVTKICYDNYFNNIDNSVKIPKSF